MPRVHDRFAKMDWNDVRVFAAVARAESLSAGARDAGLDRSTASRRIPRPSKPPLEPGSSSGLAPGFDCLPWGARLREHAERMAGEARAFVTSADEGSSAASGRVRIATTEALAATLVRRGLLELRNSHPNLELELLGANRVVNLARGEADLALRVTKVAEPSLRVRRVARLPFHALAGEPYIRRRGRPRSERELSGHDVLLHSGELATLPEARWSRAVPASASPCARTA